MVLLNFSRLLKASMTEFTSPNPELEHNSHSLSSFFLSKAV